MHNNCIDLLGLILLNCMHIRFNIFNIYHVNFYKFIILPCKSRSFYFAFYECIVNTNMESVNVLWIQASKVWMYCEYKHGNCYECKVMFFINIHNLCVFDALWPVLINRPQCQPESVPVIPTLCNRASRWFNWFAHVHPELMWTQYFGSALIDFHTTFTVHGQNVFPEFCMKEVTWFQMKNLSF